MCVFFILSSIVGFVFRAVWWLLIFVLIYTATWSLRSVFTLLKKIRLRKSRSEKLLDCFLIFNSAVVGIIFCMYMHFLKTIFFVHRSRLTPKQVDCMCVRYWFVFFFICLSFFFFFDHFLFIFLFRCAHFFLSRGCRERQWLVREWESWEIFYGVTVFFCSSVVFSNNTHM